jgi:hypothetical protein
MSKHKEQSKFKKMENSETDPATRNVIFVDIYDYKEVFEKIGASRPARGIDLNKNELKSH